MCSQQGTHLVQVVVEVMVVLRGRRRSGGIGQLCGWVGVGVGRIKWAWCRPGGLVVLRCPRLLGVVAFVVGQVAGRLGGGGCGATWVRCSC